MTEKHDTPTLDEGSRPDRPVELHPGAKVGRYAILDHLGQGGMGVVYAAYDPRLDRKIALKLLKRRARDSALETRLLREAQALARLSHPHVLTVYDVGTFGDQIFLATEYVDGWNLAEWLRVDSRSTEEILDVFVQAGRGLDAAHRAGLVHRDFKPGNVMLRAEDGRALVLDFGLARRAQTEARDPRHSRSGAGSSVGILDSRLTHAGAVLGTPAFMAPEQWEGREAGEAADQFGFCVALYSALYGELPFGDRSDSSKPMDWKVRPAPEHAGAAGREVPAKVRAALLRGLSRRPEDRYPSIEALLQDLADTAKSHRWGAWAAGLLLAVGLGISVWNDDPPCSNAGQQIEEVWNPGRAGQMERAFSSIDKPYLEDVLRSAGILLTDYSQSWREQAREACEATHLRHEQSALLLDRRVACLEERRRELDALATLFIGEPESTIEGAVQAAGRLTPLEICSDTEALMAPMDVPSEASEQRRIEELRSRLATHRADLAAGRYRIGLDQALQLVDDMAEEAYLPVLAEGLLSLGKAQELQAQAREGAATLEKAVAVAQAANHHRVGAEALVQLVRVHGFLRNDFEKAAFYARLAGSALDRLDRGEDLRARLADHIGIVEAQKGEVSSAVLRHQEALRLKTETVGRDHPSTARTLIRLGQAHQSGGSFDPARDYYEEALAIQERHLGSDHPALADTLEILAGLEMEQGRLEASEEAYRRSSEILRRVFGELHPRVAGNHINLGITLSSLGRHAISLQLFEQAIQIYEQSFGDEHYSVALGWLNVGSTLEKTGDFDGALYALQRAASILEKSYPAGHPWRLSASHNLAEVENARERYAQAARLHGWVLERRLETLGDHHFDVGHSRLGLGRAYLGLGRKAEAIVLFRQALEIWQSQEVDPSLAAHAHALLAESLVEENRDEALASARRAMELFKASPGDHAEPIAKLESLLKANTDR